MQRDQQALGTEPIRQEPPTVPVAIWRDACAVGLTVMAPSGGPRRTCARSERQ
jgi:hypothetical protein